MAEEIAVQCPACGKRGKARAEFEGRQMECVCGSTFEIKRHATKPDTTTGASVDSARKKQNAASPPGQFLGNGVAGGSRVTQSPRRPKTNQQEAPITSEAESSPAARKSKPLVVYGLIGIITVALLVGGAAFLLPDGASTTDRKPEIAQEPVAQEPVAQEPVAQEPVEQEPVEQEPVEQEPVEPVAVAAESDDPVVEAAKLINVESLSVVQSKHRDSYPENPIAREDWITSRAFYETLNAFVEEARNCQFQQTIQVSQITTESVKFDVLSTSQPSNVRLCLLPKGVTVTEPITWVGEPFDISQMIAGSLLVERNEGRLPTYFENRVTWARKGYLGSIQQFCDDHSTNSLKVGTDITREFAGQLSVGQSLLLCGTVATLIVSEENHFPETIALTNWSVCGIPKAVAKHHAVNLSEDIAATHWLLTELHSSSVYMTQQADDIISSDRAAFSMTRHRDGIYNRFYLATIARFTDSQVAALESVPDKPLVGEIVISLFRVRYTAQNTEKTTHVSLNRQTEYWLYGDTMLIFPGSLSQALGRTGFIKINKHVSQRLLDDILTKATTTDAWQQSERQQQLNEEMQKKKDELDRTRFAALGRIWALTNGTKITGYASGVDNEFVTITLHDGTTEQVRKRLLKEARDRSFISTGKWKQVLDAFNAQ
jgi:hypothetical protein